MGVVVVVLINTKSYKNLMFLPFEIENKLLIVIPALRIAVKPALGDHPIVKLKVVAQNRWLLNEGRLLGVVLSLYCEFVS